MTPASPAAPGTAGGAQEAATPVEALAVHFAERAEGCDWSSGGRGQAAAYRISARRVRERLAPAWDALAAENERLRQEAAGLSATLADTGRIAGRYRAALEHIRDTDESDPVALEDVARAALEATP